MAKVFVGDLSYFCTHTDLLELFSTVGPVVKAMVKRTVEGDSRHYGFVHMSNEDDINKAVSKFHGTMFMGRIMRVKSCDESGEGEAQENPSGNQCAQVHVSFLSHKVEPQIDETFISSLFAARFGSVMDCLIKRYTSSCQPTERQSGYGFVFFQNLEDAQRAISELSRKRPNANVDGVCFDCKLSREVSHLVYFPKPSFPAPSTISLQEGEMSETNSGESADDEQDATVSIGSYSDSPREASVRTMPSIPGCHAHNAGTHISHTRTRRATSNAYFHSQPPTLLSLNEDQGYWLHPDQIVPSNNDSAQAPKSINGEHTASYRVETESYPRHMMVQSAPNLSVQPVPYAPMQYDQAVRYMSTSPMYPQHNCQHPEHYTTPPPPSMVSPSMNFRSHSNSHSHPMQIPMIPFSSSNSSSRSTSSASSPRAASASVFQPLFYPPQPHLIPCVQQTSVPMLTPLASPHYYYSVPEQLSASPSIYPMPSFHYPLPPQEPQQHHHLQQPQYYYHE